MRVHPQPEHRFPARAATAGWHPRAGLGVLHAALLAALLLVVFTVRGAHAGAAPDTSVSFTDAPDPAAAQASHASTAAPAAPSSSAAPAHDPGPQSAAIPGGGPQPPTSLKEVNAWLTYKAQTHRATLPDEARLFYRRGLMAHQGGSPEAAFQHVRAASQLDPTFALPYWTLGSWLLTREPGQALAQFAALLEVARQSFTLQLAVEANVLYFLVQALLLGLLVTGMMIIVVRNRELRHPWQESLRLRIAPSRAAAWSIVLLVVPFVVGLGPALPTVLFLGLLWPVLKRSERALFVVLTVSLAGLPLLIGELDRLGSPLREDREPLYGVLHLQNEPYSPEELRRLTALTVAHPSNAFLHFGRGWIARRGGDLPAAEESYRRALQQWPDDDRVLNNLGNVLDQRGREDEALEAYQKAVDANPFNAAAYYNMSRIYTVRYEFRAAQDAMERAEALNFDPLKPYQTQIGTHEALPPVDLWISPRRFWNALAEYRAPHGVLLALPPLWRTRIECAGWPFTFVVAVCALLGLTLGLVQQRAAPLKHCGNCGRVVCRRCAERKREIALCQSCGAVAARAEAPEFASILLRQHRLKLRNAGRLRRTAFATLIPGFGLVGHRRMFPAVLLLSSAAGLCSTVFGAAAPFSYEPRVLNPDAPLPPALVVLPWVAIYLMSLAGYFVEQHRAEARFDAQGPPLVRPQPRRVVAKAA